MSQRPSGTVPVNAKSDKSNSFSVGIEASSVGIVPLICEFPASLSTSNCCNCPKYVVISPTMKLSDMSTTLRAVKSPISGGMGPCERLFISSNSVSCCPRSLQVLPVDSNHSQSGAVRDKEPLIQPLPPSAKYWVARANLCTSSSGGLLVAFGSRLIKSLAKAWGLSGF